MIQSNVEHDKCDFNYFQNHSQTCTKRFDKKNKENNLIQWY